MKTKHVYIVLGVVLFVLFALVGMEVAINTTKALLEVFGWR